MTQTCAPARARTLPTALWPSTELILEIIAGVVDDQRRGGTATDVGLEVCQRLGRLQRAHLSGGLTPHAEGAAAGRSASMN